MKCRICRSISSDNSVYQAREMLLGFRDSFNYFECAQCGCLQICEFPNNIAKYYPEDYYSFKKAPSFTRRIKDFFKKHRDSYIFGDGGFTGRMLASLSPNPTLELIAAARPTIESKILDVGCGRCALVLNSIKNIGFKNVLGIDPYLPSDIHEENGLRILKKSLPEMEGTWDVIMFHHSFEHLTDPRGTLSSVRRLLAPGGLCLIRIPLVSSLAWRRYGINWAQLDAPRHFYLHSLKSMELLASEFGFKIDDVRYDSDAFQFWGSEQYARDIPGKSGPICSRRQMRNFRKAAEELNRTKQGDQAAFYLRRI